MSLKISKFKAAHPGQKVDHPLAKYNSKGDLYCLLCNTLIKNGNVWKVHLSSKNHKENMILFKAGKNRNSDSLKRSAPKAEEAPPRSLKKIKPNTNCTIQEIGVVKSEIVKTSTPDNKSLASCSKAGILKPSSKVVPKLPEGFVPKSRQKVPTVKTACNPSTLENNPDLIRAAEVKSNLPSGFFDDNIVLTLNDDNYEGSESGKDVNEEEEIKPVNPASNLPDGFFDDAREDAKARKVEYKDPQEVEWEKFQNEMEQEDIRYETILEEDDQKLREERDVGIGIEQKLWDYRVESMAESVKTGDICIADKHAFEIKLGKTEKLESDELKEEAMDIKQEESNIDVKMEGDSMSSDDDFDDVMDWRVKKGL